jgi:arylsulfatase
MPDKLKQMQDVFYAEAKKYNVFPLDNSTLARFLTPRPSTTAGRKVFEYSGELTGTPPSCAPNIMAKDYTIEAQVEVPKGGAEGMIVTEGGRFGGYGLFLTRSYSYWLESRGFKTAGLGMLLAGLLLTWVGKRRRWSGGKLWIGYGMLMLVSLWVVAALATRMLDLGKGKPVFLYNLLNLKRTTWAGPSLGAGKHTIVFDYKSDGPDLGKGGTGVLNVDGKEVARNSMKNGTPITFPEDETFDIGQDTRTGVAMLEYRYDVPFKFTGKINKLTFKLEPEPKAASEPKAELGPTMEAPKPEPIDAPER